MLARDIVYTFKQVSQAAQLRSPALTAIVLVKGNSSFLTPPQNRRPLTDR